MRLSPEAEQECTALTRRMVNELRLNEPGYIKLKALNRKRMAQTEEAKQTFRSDAYALQNRLQEIELAYEQELLPILKPNQLQAYAEYKESAKAKFVAASEERRK